MSEMPELPEGEQLAQEEPSRHSAEAAQEAKKRRRAWIIAGVAATVLILGGVAAVVLLNRGLPEVPDVVGMKVPEAEAALTEVGYVPEYQKGPEGPGAWAWMVWRQDHLDGDTVELWAITKIISAVEACDLSQDIIGDDGTSVDLDSSGKDLFSGTVSAQEALCVVGELDIPDSVRSRMTQTRALDGRQEATWSNLSASWSYHPDKGLDVIVEMVP